MIIYNNYIVYNNNNNNNMANRRTVVTRNKTKRIKQQGGTLSDDLAKLVPSGSILTGNQLNTNIAFHPTEMIIATGSDDNTAKLWLMSSDYSSATCVATLEGHTDSVSSVAFHPTKPFLATGSRDNTIRLWRIYSPEEPTPTYPRVQRHLSNIPKWMSESVVAFSDRFLNWLSGIGAWRGTCVATLAGHSNWGNSVAFHPTEPFVAASVKNSKPTKLWLMSSDYTKNIRESTLDGGEAEDTTLRVLDVVFHPRARLLATGSSDHTVKLWSFNTDPVGGVCVATLKGHRNSVSSVAFHPTAPLLATGSFDATVKLWQLPSEHSSATPERTLEATATLEGHRGPVTSVTFHPTAQLLATGSNDNTTKLWLISSDNSSAVCVATLEGHNDKSFHYVVFHPKEPLMATGSRFGPMILWDFTQIMSKLEMVIAKTKKERPLTGLRTLIVRRLFGISPNYQHPGSGGIYFDFNQARLAAVRRFFAERNILFSSLTFKQLKQLSRFLTQKSTTQHRLSPARAKREDDDDDADDD